MTNQGLIKNTHDPRGDILFGVNLSLSNAAGKPGRQALFEAVGKLAISHNLKGIALGSRIPSYHKYKDKMTVEEYIYGRNKTGRVYDPELKLYLDTGFQLRSIISGYFRDEKSLDYGVLLFWPNPFYSFSKCLPFLGQIFAALINIHLFLFFYNLGNRKK